MTTETTPNANLQECVGMSYALLLLKFLSELQFYSSGINIRFLPKLPQLPKIQTQPLFYSEHSSQLSSAEHPGQEDGSLQLELGLPYNYYWSIDCSWMPKNLPPIAQKQHTDKKSKHTSLSTETEPTQVTANRTYARSARPDESRSLPKVR